MTVISVQVLHAAMHASARFEMNRAYFEEFFSEWLRCKSRYRRWQRAMALCFLAAGVGMWMFLPANQKVGFVFAVVALIEFAEIYWYRARWIDARVSAKSGEPCVVELKFDESGIQMDGPTSSGHLQWKGVKELLKTPKGVLIRMGDGMSVYVPESSFSPSSSDVFHLAGFAA